MTSDANPSVYYFGDARLSEHVVGGPAAIELFDAYWSCNIFEAYVATVDKNEAINLHFFFGSGIDIMSIRLRLQDMIRHLRIHVDATGYRHRINMGSPFMDDDLAMGQINMLEPDKKLEPLLTMKFRTNLRVGFYIHTDWTMHRLLPEEFTPVGERVVINI